MSEWLFGIGVGFMFALGGLAFFGTLISIGYMIEWVEGRMK